MAVTQKHILEKEKIKVEIKEKQDNILLKKIDTLRSLLNDYYSVSEGSAEPSYKPVITLQENRQVIEEIIMKLVKKVKED